MEFQDRRGIVIVGAGLAGLSTAKELRRTGYEGRIQIVSNESDTPYDRPPLSKQYLLDGDEKALSLTEDLPASVELVQGVNAVAIDCTQQALRLSSGASIPFGRLVLATGTSPRTLPSLSRSSIPMLTLRTLGDARRLREHLKSGCKLVIIGGGPIGLELASTARNLGASPIVIEAAPRLMSRTSPLRLAQTLYAFHRLKGIEIHLDRQVSRVDGNAIELNDGTVLAADLIVVGIGVHANDGLATAAGLATHDGIFVDCFGRTTAPGIYATGDVARQLNMFSGKFERIETWSNAMEQGTSLAQNLTKLQPDRKHNAVPWFWSDQGEARTQVAGDVSSSEEVVRGDFAAGKGVSFHLRNGRLVGVAALNNPKDFNQAKRLIAISATVPVEALADVAYDLRVAVKSAESEAKHERT
ncbi:NAD(P)/FAD-dependent oxidoreductase [Variovorax paradoxus]|uniref:NAD(P)/FAD-dependent oxidoreductase n=1 Tax=Variovorax paradoxus TaxID=34073 RepID=UPI003ECE740E